MISTLVLVFISFVVGGVCATLLVAPRLGLRTVTRPDSRPPASQRSRENDPSVLSTYVKVRSENGDTLVRLRAAALERGYAVYGINAQLRVESVGQLEQLPSGAVSSWVIIRQLDAEEAGYGG